MKHYFFSKTLLFIAICAIFFPAVVKASEPEEIMIVALYEPFRNCHGATHVIMEVRKADQSGPLSHSFTNEANRLKLILRDETEKATYTVNKCRFTDPYIEYGGGGSLLINLSQHGIAPQVGHSYTITLELYVDEVLVYKGSSRKRAFDRFDQAFRYHGAVIFPEVPYPYDSKVYDSEIETPNEEETNDTNVSQKDEETTNDSQTVSNEVSDSTTQESWPRVITFCTNPQNFSNYKGKTYIVPGCITTLHKDSLDKKLMNGTYRLRFELTDETDNSCYIVEHYQFTDKYFEIQRQSTSLQLNISQHGIVPQIGHKYTLLLQVFSPTNELLYEGKSSKGNFCEFNQYFLAEGPVVYDPVPYPYTSCDATPTDKESNKDSGEIEQSNNKVDKDNDNGNHNSNYNNFTTNNTSDIVLGNGNNNSSTNEKADKKDKDKKDNKTTSDKSNLDIIGGTTAQTENEVTDTTSISTANDSSSSNDKSSSSTGKVKFTNDDPKNKGAVTAVRTPSNSDTNTASSNTSTNVVVAPAFDGRVVKLSVYPSWLCKAIQNYKDETYFCFIIASSDTTVYKYKLVDAGIYELRLIIKDETTGQTCTIDRYKYTNKSAELPSKDYYRINPCNYGIVPVEGHQYTLTVQMYDGETLRCEGTSKKGALKKCNRKFRKQGPIIPSSIPYESVCE